MSYSRAFCLTSEGTDGLSLDAAPVRPALPPLLAIGLSLWVTAAILWSLTEGITESAAGTLAIVFSVGAVGLLAATLRLRRLSGILYVLAGAFLGIALCGFSSLAFSQHQNSAIERGLCAATVRALGDFSPSDYGSAGAVSVTYDDGFSVKAYAYFDSDELVPKFGDVFSATVKIALPSENQRGFYREKRQVGVAQLSEIVDQADETPLGLLCAARESALAGFQGDASESRVLQALVCGYTVPYEGSDIEQAFTSCGLAHIVAVSGAHLVIVGSYIGLIARAFRIPKKAQIAIQLLFVLAYLAFSGFPLSGVRAFIMMTLAQVSLFAKRRSAGLSALGFCIATMIAFDITCALSASFALSALSTLGIALFNDLISRWISRWVPRLPRLGRDALSLTLSSMIACQPYSCALFSQMPLVSPLANIVAVPIVAPLCGVGIAAAVSLNLFPVGGGTLCSLSLALCKLLCHAVQACSSLPLANVPLYVEMPIALAVTLGLVCGLWALWPLPPLRKTHAKRKMALVVCGLLACFLVVFALQHVHRGDEVIMLDVGQGDAFLIRSEGAAVLVDTGASESLLRQALARNGVQSIDAVLVTHGDDDHCGALASLGQSFIVSRVLIAEDGLSCPCDSCGELRNDASGLVGEGNVVGVELGDTITVGSFQLEIVWPTRYEAKGGNEDSVCFALRYHTEKQQQQSCVVGLFTGDAEAQQLDEIISEHGFADLDILKVGHHGSRNALTEEQAQWLSPAFALISVGERNRYGHPAPEIVSFLEDSGTRVMRTDTDGDVSCKFDNDDIVVETLR
ncbi:MAG TPA: ComEC/Rec2 family competence protein [Candidatus Aphodovivens excrementavium]|nr:ComEC/Rec2 family competence protein [Candidatus Aphodovivens excrementavium]